MLFSVLFEPVIIRPPDLVSASKWTPTMQAILEMLSWWPQQSQRLPSVLLWTYSQSDAAALIPVQWWMPCCCLLGPCPYAKCYHEIKRCLLLGTKAMINPDSILKSKDTTLQTNCPSSQGHCFSSGHVWMWEWTIKKAEHQRIDAFELWCWRRLLRVPWTARRSSQSILKEISPGCSLEGLMLKLKLQ